jgi:hypothetical protein
MAVKSALSQGGKLNGILVLFTALAITFLVLPLGSAIYAVLLVCAVVWLVEELKFDSAGKSLRNAFFIGVFLMAFDFAVENLGGFLGYWRTYESVFPLYFVPLEIMLVCIFGGMAWALYLPKKFNAAYSVFDILFFSFFGTAGESLLIRNGLMHYSGGWTSVHAFFGYVVTWIILHFIRYGVLEV